MSKYMDMFERAAREKIRFPSTKNDLTVEQLFDVPLRSSDTFNLDVIARELNLRVEKNKEDKSFVDAAKKQTPTQARTELAFEIVKHVINVKLDEEKKSESRAKNRAERAKLLQALSAKQDQKLDAMGEAALKKRIAELDEENDE